MTPRRPLLTELRSLLSSLGQPEPVAITSLSGGSSPTFRIDCASGVTLVLKTYSLAEMRPAHEAYASSLLAHLDAPVIRYLVIDESRERLPFRFALTTHLPGEPVGTFMAAREASDLQRQMGALLRKLHTVRMPAFGHFDEQGVREPVASNLEYMRKVADDAFTQFRKYGADIALAAQLASIVDARADLFAASRGPVFAHDDFHPNNVLAASDGAGGLRLSGLIDFGNARAADAVFDLAKTIFICEHDAPGSSSEILDGYGPIDHPDPEGALWLYTLLHRVIMWWWLRHVGAIAGGAEHDLLKALRAMADEERLL